MTAPTTFPQSNSLLTTLNRLVAWASDVNSILRTTFGRVALRATVSYLALFAPVVFSSLGFLGLPLYWYERLWYAPASAIAHGLGSGSGPLAVTDDRYQLALVLCFAIVAAIVTIAWTILAKPKRDYISIHDWARVALRYILIYVALHYGIAMLMRFELPAITPEALVMRAGELRTRELLWLFFGWLWYFPFFLGALELAAAILLLRRDTSLLGGLLLGGLLSNVVLLNFAFDIPGKILSPHIAFMTVLLLLPNLDRIWRTHVSREAVPEMDITPNVPGPGWLYAHRFAIKTALVSVFALSSILFVARSRGYLFNEPREALSGLYKVSAPSDSIASQMSEPDRWQWAIVAPDGSRLHVQHRNELWSSYPLAIDTTAKRLLLNAARPSEWRERSDTPAWREIRRNAPASTMDTLRYSNTKGTLKIDGTLAGRSVALVLQPVNLQKQFIIVGPRRSFEIRDPGRTRRDIAPKDTAKRPASSAKQK
jgi:hypothetical protein